MTVITAPIQYHVTNSCGGPVQVTGERIICLRCNEQLTFDDINIQPPCHDAVNEGNYWDEVGVFGV